MYVETDGTMMSNSSPPRPTDRPIDRPTDRPTGRPTDRPARFQNLRDFGFLNKKTFPVRDLGKSPNRFRKPCWCRKGLVFTTKGYGVLGLGVLRRGSWVLGLGILGSWDLRSRVWGLRVLGSWVLGLGERPARSWSFEPFFFVSQNV